MTSEIVEFKCPLCRHQLGETEYRQVCEKNIKLREQGLEQLKIQHVKDMRQLQEKYDIEKEKEVNIRLNQEKMWMQLKQQQDLAEKDKEIERVRQQGAEQFNHIKAMHLQSEKENELKLKRLETKLEQQQKIIDSKSSELRGTAGEFVLVELLQKEFPRDNFTTKMNGKQMADVIQTIVTEKGEIIPTPIVYDVKMGDKVTKSDIAKAKNYMSIHKTPHSIIVTKDIKNERYTEEREGVLLVRPLAIPDIAQQLRKSLIETGVLTRNSTNRNTKESKLYNYFTSQEYTMSMRKRIELKLKYDSIDRKEEALRNQKNDCVDELVELDYKIDAIVMDITQDTTEYDIDIQNQTESINAKNKEGPFVPPAGF
jgi:hypothetical protein